MRDGESRNHPSIVLLIAGLTKKRKVFGLDSSSNDLYLPNIMFIVVMFDLCPIITHGSPFMFRCRVGY